jgi:prepilin peptidase CpaA
MMWGNLSVILPVVLAALLLWCGIEDARQRTIADWKNATIAVLAPIWWWATGLALWPDVAVQIGVALLIFGLFVGVFALGQMGGGDVKLIGALALWFPWQPLLGLLMLMSIIGGVLTVIVAIERWWRKSEGPPEIPYGVAIAIAGLIAVREPLLNQFT